MEFLFVEGLAGVGKTFVILTMRNITRKIEGRNSADMATAPTGCAASLIHGQTTYRASNLPCGPALQVAPSNSANLGANQLKVMRHVHSGIVLRTKDEHSMDGRALWGWLEHRTREFRQTCHTVDEEMNVIACDFESPHPQAVLQMPWAGLPKLAFFGDHAQLPNIGQKRFMQRLPETQVPPMLMVR